jgi:hypothetical protein
MAEIVVAGSIVGCDIRASAGDSVEIGSCVADMALPFMGRGRSHWSLSLSACHGICDDVDQDGRMARYEMSRVNSCAEYTRRTLKTTKIKEVFGLKSEMDCLGASCAVLLTSTR